MDTVIVDWGPNRVRVIRCLAHTLGWSLRGAKEFVDRPMPRDLADVGLAWQREKLFEQLRDVGVRFQTNVPKRDPEHDRALQAKARTIKALQDAFDAFVREALENHAHSFEDGTEATFCVQAGRMEGELVGATIEVTYRSSV